MEQECQIIDEWIEKSGTKREYRSRVRRSESSKKIRAEKIKKCRMRGAKRKEKIRSEKSECTRR